MSMTKPIFNVQVHLVYRPEMKGMEVFVTGDNGLQESYLRYALECPQIRYLSEGEAAPRLCFIDLNPRSAESLQANALEMQRAGITAPGDMRNQLLRSQERLITSLYAQLDLLQKPLRLCPGAEYKNPCEETGEANPLPAEPAAEVPE